jgi:IS5 family transposase
MQMTFGDIEYQQRKKLTRRECFLQTMDKIIPWQRFCCLIKPYYYKNKTGRPARGIETMLRMYFLQIWFNLSDEMTEDSILDSRAMRDFMGINFFDAQAPDATTLMQFRHLLEKHGLQKKVQDEILKLLEENHLIMHGGTIADATIIKAASSTRNADKERDPEMKSTRKGNNYHFGMKAHTGVDAGTGAVVSTSYTAANVHDIKESSHNFRADDDVRYGDAGYIGIEKRVDIKICDVFNRDFRTKETIDYRINKRPKSRTEKHPYPMNFEKSIEARKSATRWMVEYPYYILKRIFGCNKAIYKGIKKNGCRFDLAFGLVNLYMFRHRLLT